MSAWVPWGALILITMAGATGSVFLLTLPARRRNREMWAKSLPDSRRPGTDINYP